MDSWPVVAPLVALVLACVLLVACAVRFVQRRVAGALLQLVGAGFLLIVALAHVAEALRVFPIMHWGEAHSAGHYLDLSSAGLGVTLFALGYFLRARKRARLREPT
jgi:hypothetical protein